MALTLGQAIFYLKGDRSQLRDTMAGAEREGSGFGARFAGTVKTAITTTLVAGGVAVAGFAAGALKEFVGFQGGMNEVLSLIPGTSADTFGAMRQQVKDLAVDMGVLPDQIVPALYESLSSGVPQDTVFDFLETAQQAAVGGVTQLATVVNGLTSVTNAYGADVLSAGQASDQMFVAVKLGKTTFDELAQSLYNVVPTAAGLKVPFGDIAAGLAAITAQGTPTSVATTQLRALLGELSKEGSATAATFEKIAGKSFKDFIAGGGNLQQALQLMEAAAKKNNLGVSDMFSSIEAGNAALQLTGRGTQLFSQALGEMQTSAGATQAAYETMDQGIGRSIDKLKASFKVMLLDVGDRLAPTFARFTTFLVSSMPMVASVVVRAFEVMIAGGEWLGSRVLPMLINGWRTVSPIVMQAAAVLQLVGRVLGQLAAQAAGWGQRIVGELAGGMSRAAPLVTSVLQGIGRLITYWLRPQSPPNLLPDIDEWGAATMRVYMSRWADPANFTIFSQISSTLEGYLRSVVDMAGGVAREGLVPMIVGSRAAVAEAITQMRETGSVSEEALNKIRAAAGPAGEMIARLVELTAEQYAREQDVIAVQKELADATSDYDGRLGDLNDQLDETRDRYEDVLGGLRDELAETQAAFDTESAPVDAALAENRARQQAIDDAQRMADLQEVINDAESTGAEKEKARLEQEEILLRQQRDEIEARRDAAVEAKQAEINATEQARDADLSAREDAITALETERDAALAAIQTRLDAATAAKSEADAAIEAHRASIQVAQEDNRLLNEQIELLKQIQAEKEAAAKAGAAGGGALGGAGAAGLDLGGIAIPGVDTGAAAAGGGGAGVSAAADRLAIESARAAAATRQQFEETEVVATRSERTVGDAIGSLVTQFAGLTAGLGVAAFTAAAIPLAWAGITAAGSGLLAGVLAVGGGIGTLATAMGSGGLLGVLGAVVAMLGGPVTLAIGAAALLAGVFAAAWVQNLGGVRDFIQPFIDRLGILIDGLQEKIAQGLVHLAPVGEMVSATFEKLLPIASVFIAGVMAVLGGLIGFVSGALPGVFMAAAGIIQAFLGVVNLIADVVTGVVTIVYRLLTGDFAGAWQAAKDLVGNVAGDVIQIVGGLVEGFIGLIGGLVTGVVRFFTDMYFVIVGGSIVPDLVRDVLAWIGRLPGEVLAFVKRMADNAVEQFLAMKDRALAQIAEWIVSLGLKWIEIETKAREAWELVKGAIKTKLDETKADLKLKLDAIIDTVTGIGTRLRDAGASIFQQLWDGLKAKWDEIKRWFDEKLQALQDMLPGSEPRNPLSPLRNLGRRGAAILGNIRDGMEQAGPLRVGDVLVGTPIVPRITDALTGAVSAVAGQAPGGNTFQVILPNAVIRDDRDIDRLAEQIFREAERKWPGLRLILRSS